MAEKLFSRFALLLFLGAIIMNVSAESDPDESSSKEKAEESGEKKSKTTTTESPQKNADTKAMDEVILDTFRLKDSDLKADDFEDFLKAMEFKKADRDKIRNAPHIDIKITKQEKHKYEIQIFAGVINVKTTKFTLGKEFDDKLFDGRTYKGTITFEGKDKMVVEEKHAGFTCHHEFVFTKKGITGKLDCKGAKAEQEYKRFEKPKNPFKDGGVFSINFGR